MKPIIYRVVFECIRPDTGVVAEYESRSPLPDIEIGESLELVACTPRIWEVTSKRKRFYETPDEIHWETVVAVDSSAFDN